MDNQEIHEGLERITVARTALSEVDGEGGRLIVAGHPIETLAGRVHFEDVVLLLREGELPSAAKRDELRAELGRERALAAQRTRLSASGEGAMDAVRTALSALPAAASVTAMLATAAVTTGAFCRALDGAPSVAPNPALGHAEDLLRLAVGHEVSTVEVALLDAYLVTVAEHGMNASTFATRVVASTGADRVAAVVAGVAALSGPLHGGAPGPVLDLLDRVGDPAQADRVVARELAEGRRIMGMGHRVYRVRDPRAFVLERALTEASGALASPRLVLARAVESAAEHALAERHPERALKANVEFYTAVLLDAIGLPREAFSAVFACSRLAGWAAHYTEQVKHGRLIRPKALYVGPAPAGSAA